MHTYRVLGQAEQMLLGAVDVETGTRGYIAAGREQAQGVAGVSEAVSQLDQVTQQNAALAERSSAAAHSLKDQAGNLAGAVGLSGSTDNV